MEKQIIIDKLKDLIEGQDEIKISSPDQKLDIDSYTMMLVITYVREEMEVQLDMDALDFDAFTSLNSLSDIVAQQAAA
jgi:acyl carrier protein